MCLESSRGGEQETTLLVRGGQKLVVYLGGVLESAGDGVQRPFCWCAGGQKLVV